MKITFKTLIKREFQTVVSGFNKNLLKYIIPSWLMPVIKRYDGQDHGDMVHISFGFPGLADWKVVVKDSGITDKTYWLIHRGLIMSSGLIFWNHVHRVVSLGRKKSAIIDHIEFRHKWRILNLVFYMLLLIMFLFFKFRYKRYYYKQFSPKQNQEKSNQSI